MSNVVALRHSQLAQLAPNYEAMRHAIAVCEKVDEIAELADRAVAAQAYFRQSQDVENEIGASRVRVRAERKLGEILKRQAENGERHDGRNAPNVLASRDATPTLSDLGIPRDRASRAMQLAAVPEDEFEAALAEPKIAQPRRILDERKPELVPIKKTLNLWGRVRDLGTAITAGEVPSLDLWRTNLQPFQLEELRRSIPVVIEYLSVIQEELKRD
jgi:hypothetical protein